MCSLALGWGTFSVSNEYYLEPPQRLSDELKKHGISEMQFFLLKHGESRLIEIKEANDEELQELEHPTNGAANGHTPTADHQSSTSSSSDHDADQGLDLIATATAAVSIMADADADADADVHVTTGEEDNSIQLTVDDIPDIPDVDVNVKVEADGEVKADGELTQEDADVLQQLVDELNE